MARSKTGGGIGTNQYGVKGSTKYHVPPPGVLSQAPCLLDQVSSEPTSHASDDVKQLGQEWTGMGILSEPDDSNRLIDELTSILGSSSPSKAKEFRRQWDQVAPAARTAVAGEIVQELLYDLDDVAPANHYFGAMEADPKMLGFWPNNN